MRTSIEQGLRFACLALAACAFYVLPASADDQVDDAFYLARVSAPALKLECEKLRPGYAAYFDAHFPEWTERHAHEIAAARAGLLAANPEKDGEQLDDTIVRGAYREFEKSSVEEQTAICNDYYGMLAH